jgi:hypothetical protein
MPKNQHISRFAIALLLGVSAASAQERPVDVYPTSPFNIQTGFESGVPNGNRRLNEPATIVTFPTLSFMRTSPRNDFTFSYLPEFEVFTSLHKLDSFNQNAGLRWVANMTPRWNFSVNDVFNSTSEEGQRFESTFLLPRGAYRENGFYSSVNFDVTERTRIKFRYENAFVAFSAVNLSRPLFFSRLGNTEGITVDHHLTERVKIGVSYSYLRAISFDKYDTSGNLILPFAPSQFATSTFSFNATPSLLLEFTGGYVHSPSNSYLLGGLIEKHLNRLTIAGGYSRYLTFAGGPSATSVDSAVDMSGARLLPPDSISNTVSFRAQGYFTYHWGIDTTIMASRTAGATSLTTLRSAMGGLRVNYRISDSVSLFTNLGLYRQNANVILPVPISRSRLFGGIEYTFSPTPDQIARRRELARSHTQPQAAALPQPGPPSQVPDEQDN